MPDRLRQFWWSEAGRNWRAALLLGLISSTFSTVVSQTLAGRIGRDAAVDWMVVAAIPGGNDVLQVIPDWPVIIGGILFHQWADISWAVFFFGLLGRWTARLRPWTITVVAAPWALFTSATEWFVLVPLFPFWQPVFPLEQPYWIGLLVHLSSASLYPLYPWLRYRGHRRFTAIWGGLSLASGCAFVLMAVLGSHGYEAAWMGHNPAHDQAYIVRMSGHHAQGVDIARIAIAQSPTPRMRELARLMAAEQIGEIRIFDQWWRSWFGGPTPLCTAQDEANMPGMLTPEQIGQLRHAPADSFDAQFVRFMSLHHLGAVVMAQDEIDNGSDPRLRIMAQAIRHSQQGEIALMHGVSGIQAVATAAHDLVSPHMATTSPAGESHDP